MTRTGFYRTSVVILAVCAMGGLYGTLPSNADEPPKKPEESVSPAPDRPAPPDRPERRGGPEGERHPPHGPEFMRVIDADKDGRISREELAKAPEKFNELDQDRDGQLDPRELMGPPPNNRDAAAGGPRAFRGRFGPGPGRSEDGEEGPRRSRRPRGPEGEGPEGTRPDGPPERPPFEGRRSRNEIEGDGPPRRARFGGPQGFGSGPGNRSVDEVVHRMFEHLDGNDDGKLTADEAPPKIKERFAKIDTNGDGAIDEAELCKIGMMAQRLGPGGRDRGQGRARLDKPEQEPSEKPADPTQSN